MSLFRHASAWTLRALALWGAIELGAALYDQGADASRAIIQLSGHRAAMARLEDRARVQEAQAAALEARQAAAAPDTIAASTPIVLATMLREHLIQIGAQAPVVEATAPNASSGPTALTARWREPRANAPQAFYALAQRFPQLGVQRLKLETQGDLVQAEADFTASLRASSRGSQ